MTPKSVDEIFKEYTDSEDRAYGYGLYSLRRAKQDLYELLSAEFPKIKNPEEKCYSMNYNVAIHDCKQALAKALGVSE